MKRQLLTLAAVTMAATAADAQLRLPVIIPLGKSQPAPPPAAPGVPLSPGALQADLVVKGGSDTVYFSRGGATLDANATAVLAAQARWLLANPFVRIRLDGHGGPQDTRDYALAIGVKRADSVRDFLVLQGIDPSRISVTSWGKERPGSVRVGTAFVAAGPRVVTVVQ